MGDGNDQPTPPFASVPSFFPEPYDPEQNLPPPRTVVVVPVLSMQGAEQPFDRSVGPTGSKAPMAAPPPGPSSSAVSTPMGPEDGPLEDRGDTADHEEEGEVAVDEQPLVAHEHEPLHAVPPIQPTPPPPRRSSRPNKGVPPIRFPASAMTALGADGEENPYDLAYLAEDDCDTDSYDEVEYLDEDEEEEGTWGGRKTTGVKWLLKKKLRPDGTMEKYRARLVAKGFSQRFGIDYDDTNAPLDVKNAFLHSTIDHEIYVQHPPYFTDGSSKVCLLHKSHYGLKQSPLLWYKELDKVLLVEGHMKSLMDHSLYYKDGASEKRVRLLIYVDDLLAASEDKQLMQDPRELLPKAFQLREVEPEERYLGLQIVRDRPNRTLLLHQKAYVEKVQQRFFKGAPPKKQPITPLSSASFCKQHAGQFANRTMTDRLAPGAYLRTEMLWHELFHTLSYWAASSDMGLLFKGGPESLTLVGNADADDAGDKGNWSSTGGYLFKLGGAAVS
ncbi:unnamed protein product [Closterium sp. NIES-54]